MTTITTFDDARAAVAGGASASDAARAVVAAMTPDEKLWCLAGDGPTWAGLGYLGKGGYHQAPFPAAVVERIGLPGIAFSDGPRGAVVGNATAFPVAMARGATWDPELEERVGEVIGRELRAIGANLTGAVCINVLRHPAWGRAQETYGEDPHHVGEMGAAFTRGLQRHVMACAKHFACNSMENARFSVDVQVDEVALHEVYLPHFRRVVDEGVASIMSAYNSVNGEWCGQNRELLTDVLRDEWGFEGFVISDWIFGLRDGVLSLSAGLDIEMPYQMIRPQHLPAALDSGEASWAEVDTAVERVVATLLRFDAVLSTPPPTREILGAPEHRTLAREVAARSAVLLRNESVDGVPVLPLSPGQRVAVVGRLADVVNLGDGGSSDVWDLDCHSIVRGMREAGCDVEHDDGADVARAASLAAAADVALVVVGYTFLDEGEFIGESNPELSALLPKGDDPAHAERFAAFIERQPITERPAHLAERPAMFSMGGDRGSLRLPDDDVALIRAVTAVNPRTIVAIQAGSAVVISEWVDQAPAVVQSWYAGCRAGEGLADVLTGAVEPGGRLPFSVPAHEMDLPAFDRDATQFVYDRWHGWWYLAREGTTPAYPFGFGLGYTTFVVRDVTVTTASEEIVVEATVSNTGDRAGSDVVQVYVELPGGAPARLGAFARVEVDAGGSTQVRMTVPFERLATRDAAAHVWTRASGSHSVTVGRFVGDPDASRHVVDL